MTVGEPRLTFVCCPDHALHDGSPVHHIVVCGAKLKKRIVRVGLVCLELRHEALRRRRVTGGACHAGWSGCQVQLGFAQGSRRLQYATVQRESDRDCDCDRFAEAGLHLRED